MKNLKDSYIYRFLKTAFGLFLCGTGGYFTMQANVGLAPWDSLNVGFSNITGLIYGDVSIIIGVIIIAVDLLVLKEKIGFGTLMNTVMYAKWVDLWNYVELVPKQQDMIHGLPMLFFGMIIMSFGMWIYMSGGMGCGPRDTFFVGVGKRFRKAPIGVVKAVIEVIVSIMGALLGAKIGIGTIIFIFLQSSILQLVFHITRFKARDVKHENFADTVRNIKKRRETAA